MKISKGYSFRACYNKGVRNHHLYFVETQMQAKKVGKLYNAKNVNLWLKVVEAGGELTRSGASYVIGFWSIFGFLFGLELETEGKK